MDIDSPISRMALGQEATDVAVPLRNSPFFNELIRWIVWREKSSIKAINTISSTPVSIDLTDEPAYLVRPPLKTTGGPVEVLAVSKDQQELHMVSFGPESEDQGQQVKLAWTSPLPARPSSITAALAPESRQSDRHVAFAVQRDKEFEIFHSRYRINGLLEPFQSVKVEKANLLSNTPLAMFVDIEGKTYISVLVVMDEKDHSCALVEVEFTETDQPIAEPGVTDLGTISAKPIGGAVLYVDKDGTVVRREAVVNVEGNGIFRLNSTGQLVPISVPGVPTTPILLAPGAQLSYILYFDSKRGLYFEPL